MKRILVENLSGLDINGITNHILTYISVLSQKNYEIDVAVTISGNKNIIDKFKCLGCGIVYLPHRQKQLFSYIIALFRVLHKGHYDIIHIHGNSATAVIELQIAKLAGVKIRLIHNHSSRCRYRFLNRLLLPLYRLSFTQAIACSNEAGEWLYRKDGFTILRNAITVKRFVFNLEKRIVMRHAFGFKDDEYVLGHIGIFMEAKNHPFLIEIFAKYHALHPKSRLLLVGDGELRPLVEMAIDKNKVNDCVVLAGLRSDISDVLQAMDIFLFPSVYEGMPLSVVEAQASGLPCIISDTVTKLVNIGEDVIQLPLGKGTDYWVEYLSNLSHRLSRQERCEKNMELITKAGYNIETEVESLMEIYKS